MDWVTELEKKVVRQFRRPSVSHDTKAYANYRLREERAAVEKVTRGDAYEDHLLTYLQAERDKFQLDAEDVDESAYDERRSNPLCTCRGRHAHKCPIKRGNLPREVRKAEDISTGMREFRAAHRGNPVVLEEARDEWARLIADVEHLLRDLLAILASDEIPADADWQPVPDTDADASLDQSAD